MPDPNSVPDLTQASTATSPDENAKLASEKKTLERALADMEKHHAAGLAHLREREQKLREAAKSLEQTQSGYQILLHDHAELTDSHQTAQTEVQRLGTEREELQRSIRGLKAEAAIAEERVNELLTLTTANEDQIQTQEHKFHVVEKQRHETESRLNALAGEEERLLEARNKFLKTQSVHTALTEAVAAITTERTAQEGEVSALDARIRELRAGELAAQNNLVHAQNALHFLQDEAAAQKQNLQSEVAVLQKKAKDEQQSLQDATAQLTQIKAEHDELQRQDRLLHGAKEKHAEVKKLINQSEALGTQIKERNATLMQQGDELQNNLTTLQSKEKIASQRVEKLGGDEAAMQKTLDDLRTTEATERKYFAAEQQSNAEKELAAVARLTGLESKKDRHLREIVQLEARLYALQVYESDLDKRYAHLALLQEGAPEAMEQWNAIQKLKKTIADELPNKEIQVRPETRVSVVPRKK